MPIDRLPYTFTTEPVHTPTGSFRTGTDEWDYPVLVFERADGGKTVLYAIKADHDGNPGVTYDLNDSTLDPGVVTADDLNRIYLDKQGQFIVETALTTGTKVGDPASDMSPDRFAGVSMSDIWWLDEVPEERDALLVALGKDETDDDTYPGEDVPHPGAVALAEITDTSEGGAWIRAHLSPSA